MEIAGNYSHSAGRTSSVTTGKRQSIALMLGTVEDVAIALDPYLMGDVGGTIENFNLVVIAHKEIGK